MTPPGNDLNKFYTSRVQALSAGIRRLKRRGRRYILGEILSFAAFIGFIAAYTATGMGAAAVAVAVLSLAVYVLIRYADTQNSARIDRLTAVCGVYENELRYLAGDFSCFGNGSRYADPRHPFTFDLDVFGRDSLFNRINRTVTTGGSDCLAECLGRQPEYKSAADVGAINMRRDAVNAVAGMEQLRTEFVSYGYGGTADTAAILRAIDTVSRVPVPEFAVSRAALYAASASVILFLGLIILSIFTQLSGNVPVVWGLLQFFAVFMLCSGPLRKISKAVNSLQGHVDKYMSLIKLVYGSRLADMCAPAAGKTDGMKPFEELKAILDWTDRRGNVLGLVLFDTFLLSDFFLVRRFAKWRNCRAAAVRQWIDAVSAADALVSMATFKYNEPQTVSAEIVADSRIVYESRGLYHPFVGKDAVRNDFTIADGNYYIVTGANMAGKSTFLRSVGINHILAMNGMPVFADSLRVSVFSLFTSMRTSDDLASGISYFNAELLRLKQLVGECGGRRHTLIILDEILKGTNSLDKLNGSRMFLEWISRYPVSGIIATHDLEISRMAEDNAGRFHNYCFEINPAEEITYTYKIAPGVARNQNATYLLKRILGETLLHD